MILLVVLYGYDAWSLTLREEHRLRVIGNRVLRIIFGPKKDEVIGCWRKLHNEELHNLYSSLSIIRMMGDEMGRACISHATEKEYIRDFDEKSRMKEDVDIGGRIIVRWILERQDGVV
jgi:hypothetical protein